MNPITRNVSRTRPLVFVEVYCVLVWCIFFYVVSIYYLQYCPLPAYDYCLKNLYRTTDVTFAIPTKTPLASTFLPCLLASQYNLTNFIAGTPTSFVGLLLYHTCRLLVPLRDHGLDFKITILQLCRVLYGNDLIWDQQQQLAISTAVPVLYDYCTKVPATR